MDVLNHHVTIRNFSSTPIADELLHAILSSGTRASTTGNMQWYSVIVTSDPLMKEKLLPLHFNQGAVKTAPVLLTFCADISRFNTWCRLNDADPGFDNFLSFFHAAVDAILVAQNVCVAAENAGLGICYLGTAVYNASEIIDVLGLPEMVIPVTALALGWPASVPPLTDRLPLEAVVHSERYHSCSDEDIRRLYDAKEKLESSTRFVLENSKATLAQVFTDVRYKKTDNEFFSEKYLKTLKKQGFIK